MLLVNGALLAAIDDIGRDAIRLRGWWLRVIEVIPERQRSAYRKAWLRRCGQLGIAPLPAMRGRVVPRRAVVEHGAEHAAELPIAVHEKPESSWVVRVAESVCQQTVEDLTDRDPMARFAAAEFFRERDDQPFGLLWLAMVLGTTPEKLESQIRAKARLRAQRNVGIWFDRQPIGVAMAEADRG